MAMRREMLKRNTRRLEGCLSGLKGFVAPTEKLVNSDYVGELVNLEMGLGVYPAEPRAGQRGYAGGFGSKWQRETVGFGAQGGSRFASVV
ncbi:hypothetical protein OSB04_023517 [Centaurea solstitialis]|uniref:Uncharacterized protein n=1 Tax=Centaurea solstitialis TaxID=347529 RepID=A0AA38SJC8_9ASTR|nr:hypothetical protein OSB04_023517 [Centaurea solstitialis]